MIPLEAAREAVRLAEKATKGPWTMEDRPYQSNQIVEGPIDVKTDLPGRCVASVSITAWKPEGLRDARPNARLIAHAGTHYRAIATALIEAEEKVERMRERCRDLEMICLTWGMSDDDGNPWGRRVTDGKIILSLFDKDEEDGEIELESDPRTGLPILTDEARAALTALAGDPK